ncbi:MAG: protelomerase family protein [Thiotrichaceae bacterium]
MTKISEQASKVDLQAALNYLISELELLEKSKLTQSQKTARYKRIASKIKNTYLHDSDKYSNENRLAIPSLNKYLTRLRTAVRAADFKHHSLMSDSPRSWSFENEDGTKREYYTLAKVLKDYPNYYDLLITLRSEPALTLRKRLKEIAGAVISCEQPTKKQRELFNILTRKLKVEHEILFHLALDSAQKNKLKGKQANALIKKQSDVVTINRHIIAKVINDGIESQSLYKQAFALALASGRRSIEILKTGDFKKIDESSVLFSGQAKKRAGVTDAPYPIKTLIPSYEFIEAFKRFRQSDDLANIYESIDEQRLALINMGNVVGTDYENSALNAYCAKSLNTNAKRAMIDSKLARDDKRGGAVYNNTGTQVSFKDSRAIYAAVCLREYHDIDAPTLDDNAYVTSLMGHEAGNAHVHYRQFKIDYAPAEPDAPRLTDAPAEPIDAVEKFDASVKELNLPPKLAAIHERTVEWMRHVTHKALTPTTLEKAAKAGNRALIWDYLQIEGRRRVELPKLLKIIEQYNSNLNI